MCGNGRRRRSVGVDVVDVAKSAVDHGCPYSANAHRGRQQVAEQAYVVDLVARPHRDVACRHLVDSRRFRQVRPRVDRSDKRSTGDGERASGAAGDVDRKGLEGGADYLGVVTVVGEDVGEQSGGNRLCTSTDGIRAAHNFIRSILAVSIVSPKPGPCGTAMALLTGRIRPSTKMSCRSCSMYMCS